MTPMLAFLLAVGIAGSAMPRESGSSSVVLTLRRGECYGPCPMYSVTIRGDGKVTYYGRKYVKVKGTRHYKIPIDRVNQLLAEFDRIKFFDLDDSYTEIIGPDGSVTIATDLPSATTTLQIGARTKENYDYYGGPEELKALERLIDTLAETSRLTGAPN